MGFDIVYTAQVLSGVDLLSIPLMGFVEVRVAVAVARLTFNSPDGIPSQRPRPDNRGHHFQFP